MTLRALSSALSGLRVHQDWMDVIGDNLANSSTPGFRSSRARFSALLAQTVRPARQPEAPLSGTDPAQIGLGVRLQSVDLRTSQGALSETGRPFDLALRGEGFFVLSDGTRDFYTRAGAFGIDASGNLVDAGTGLAVQSAGGGTVSLASSQLLAGQATTALELGGNLPSEVSGPRVEILSSTTAFFEGSAAILQGGAAGPFSFADGDEFEVEVEGQSSTVRIESGDFADLGNVDLAELQTFLQTELQSLPVAVDLEGGGLRLRSTSLGSAVEMEVRDLSGDVAAQLEIAGSASGSQVAATAATRLDQLVSNSADYVDGDVLRLSGTNAAGEAFAADFVIGSDGETLGELVAALDLAVGDATASLDDAGQLMLSADQSGEASLSLQIEDAASNTGQTDFAGHGFAVSTEGLGPDTSRTSLDVFDASGARHTLELVMTRVEGSQWQLTVSAGDEGGAVLQGGATTVLFAEDGTLVSPESIALQVQFAGAGSGQDIALDLGAVGTLDGLTQLGTGPSFVVRSQDGFAAGELASVAVRGDGVLEGVYDNGEIRELDQLGIAVFDNATGLERLGDTLFAATVSSGDPALLSAGEGRAGVVVSGALEDSNVDVAEEFVRLIEAQRGFQANARVIRASDELLTEVVQLI